ncbi:MAG: FAD-dependent oxidoreductase, partial [Pseudohongiella sp.]
ELKVQIAIIGGGIAGLWLLNRLNQAGYDTILLEQDALGGGQTLASQGIIHGGLKYALNGALSPASSAIAAMPDRWRACLQGEGELDLQGCQVLSRHYYMWSSGSYRSRMKAFLGSKALHGRIDALKPAQYPAFFRDSGSHRVQGTVYQLTDFVVDTPSLLRTLTAPWRDRLFQCRNIQLTSDDDSTRLQLDTGTDTIDLRATRVILCAGEGNEGLLNDWQHPATMMPPLMQRRPLHMVAVRVSHPAPPYVHCIGDSFGMTPRLTLTAHPCKEDDGLHWIWYLGGELAESGMNRSEPEQHAFARRELESLFPWIDFSHSIWSSFFINRAEPRVADRQRPDNAYVEDCGPLMVCWPTKLTLCPDLGDTVVTLLDAQSFIGNDDSLPTLKALNELLPTPGIAPPPWENLR